MPTGMIAANVHHGTSLTFAGDGGELDACDGIIGYDYDLQQNFLDKASHELRL